MTLGSNAMDGLLVASFLFVVAGVIVARSDEGIGGCLYGLGLLGGFGLLAWWIFLHVRLVVS